MRKPIRYALPVLPLLLGLLTGGAGDTAHRGGTMHLLSHAPAGSIDPQINDTGQYWQIYGFTYDGLLATRKTGGAAGQQVVPDLASAMPDIQDDGRRYVFTLRDGIRFSDGQPVEVADVIASFRRIFAVSGPTAGAFYGGILGADACLKAPAHCVLPGVTGDNSTRRITIQLAAPDPEFPIKLTLPPASILPANAPPHDSGTIPLPGTGAYRIESYDPGSALHIARNPFFHLWSEAAQPEGFPDRIEESFGLEPEAELTQIENNQADWMHDPPPADRLAELGARYPQQVHLNPSLAFWYLAPNTRLPPFNDIRVRQALNMAIDRDALVKLFGGHRMAMPTCQILPPGMPGYAAYCPYPHDMQRARQLVAASGTAGQNIVLVVSTSPIQRAIGGYVQSVLRQLGYKVALRTVSGDIEFTYIQNSNNKIQLALTDWYADYPAPSDFLHVLYACDSFHPGSDASLNVAAFCDPKIDAMMRAAMATPGPMHGAPEAGSLAQWQAVDHALVDAAAAVPLFVPRFIDVVSTRIGNFTYNDQYHWLPSQSWLH